MIDVVEQNARAASIFFAMVTRTVPGLLPGSNICSPAS